MNIHFILVEPAVPENVGGSARAIKTMGYSSMRLVNPCDHLSEMARRLAHASNDILEAAKVYKNLEEATHDLDFLIGTTANQKRSSKQDFHPATELATILSGKAGALQNVGIVFGREESGLTNDELQLCDIASSIPLAAPYPSVNLSQAIMLYAYELSALQHFSRKPAADGTPVHEESYAALRQKVDALLQITELDQNPVKANRIRERLALVEQTDLNLLHTACAALLEKLGPAK